MVRHTKGVSSGTRTVRECRWLECLWGTSVGDGAVPGGLRGVQLGIMFVTTSYRPVADLDSGSPASAASILLTTLDENPFSCMPFRFDDSAACGGATVKDAAWSIQCSKKPSRRGSDSPTDTKYSPASKLHSTRNVAWQVQPTSQERSRRSRSVLVAQTMVPNTSLTCISKLSSAIDPIVVNAIVISSVFEESSGTQVGDTN